jgi:hypothetical protein
MATRPTPTFEIAKVPDQAAAAELTNKLIEHDFDITDDDMQIAAWAIVQRHDETIEKLTLGKDGFVGFNPLIASLHNSHKMAIQLRDQFLVPLVASRDKWLKRYQAYKDKREAEERKRLEVAADLQRKADAKKLEQDAKKLEKRGDVESATVLREQAATLPAPTLPFSRPIAKQAGEVDRGGWCFEVQDYAKVPDTFKLLDHTKKGECDLIDSKIRAVVSKLGDKLKIEGVRVWYEKSTSSRKG